MPARHGKIASGRPPRHRTFGRAARGLRIGPLVGRSVHDEQRVTRTECVGLRALRPPRGQGDDTCDLLGRSGRLHSRDRRVVDQGSCGAAAHRMADDHDANVRMLRADSVQRPPGVLDRGPFGSVPAAIPILQLVDRDSARSACAPKHPGERPHAQTGQVPGPTTRPAHVLAATEYQHDQRGVGHSLAGPHCWNRLVAHAGYSAPRPLRVGSVRIGRL